jgi:hypothetical protein
MTNELNRVKYQQKQAQLMHCLLAGGEAPADLDAGCLDALRESLLSKRSRTIARCWPALRLELAEEWNFHFRQYAQAFPEEFQYNALVDGLNFARWVRRRRRLAVDASRELVYAELQTSKWAIALILRQAAGTFLFGVKLGARFFIHSDCR